VIVCRYSLLLKGNQLIETARAGATVILFDRLRIYKPPNSLPFSDPGRKGSALLYKKDTFNTPNIYKKDTFNTPNTSLEVRKIETNGAWCDTR
jgi:hypothetical protein